MSVTSLIEPGIATVPEGRLAERQWAGTLDSSGWVTAPILGDWDVSRPAPAGTSGLPPAPYRRDWGLSSARRLVLPDSFYSPRVASQRGSIRCVHEVRRGEKRCLSSLRLLTWR